MILNPTKTMALVVSRFKTVNPPYGDLVMSGISIQANNNFDILGVKFDSKLTFEDHGRGIVSCVSRRFDMLRLIKLIFVDTSMLFRCYFAFVLPILEYCSPVWGSAAECHLQLFERQVYSAPGFALIRVSCCVVDIVLLGLVCCSRLMRTLITVRSARFLLLIQEFDIPSFGCSSSIRV